jgi:hypothetical protein
MEIMKSSSETAPDSSRQKWIVIVAVVAIIASVVWIYRYSAGSGEMNLLLHQSVGNTLAEETFHLVGHQGKIVLVTMDASRAPEIKVQMQAFEKELARLGGCTIADKVVLDPGENPKYRPGAGMSAKRFLKIARKHKGADAIVSFVGAPELTAEDLKQLKAVPKFIAETHSPERLTYLLEEKILMAAIVPRYDFPAPGPRQPETMKQWFDHYFQIVHPDTLLPKPDDSP